MRFAVKPSVFCACMLPVVLMTLGAMQLGPMDLGADPVRRMLHACGITALNLLLITLAITPLRQLTHVQELLRLRRMLGLFAFTYAVLHFLVYAWLDQGWQLSAILEDIAKRPYITIGLTALLLLVPLAVTSTQRMMRRLGRRWIMLHRLIYVVALLGVWHFYWQVKKDVREPLLYAAIYLVLMAWRLRGKFAPAKVPERI
jgi:sulfoxide reductase heme-binding subunit YedZ